MWSDLNELLLGWKIAFSPYVDMLQVRDPNIFKIANNDLKQERIGEAVVIYRKDDLTPMMIEFSNTYACLGDITDIAPDEIMERVIKYLQTYHQTKRA